LSLGLRGNVERADYSDLESGGVSTSQASRNLTGYGLRLRMGYEIQPFVTPFVELGADKRNYDESRDASGFARSSTGATLRMGSTFELSRVLIGEAAVGYTDRTYDDTRLSRLASPTADATLTWSISPQTTLALRAQTEIAETTIAGSSGAIAFRSTATLTHAFLRHFTATTTFQIAETDYQKVNRRELQLIGGLRLEYKLSRMVAVRGSYAYENYRVNAANSSYQAHTLLLGVRLTP
ncbi:MAG: outer membrane beta-barrel protein, partial [Methylobacterium sp.]|nr:outer membrane beta-barrel protein [Methylobacterium sp.]